MSVKAAARTLIADNSLGHRVDALLDGGMTDLSAICNRLMGAEDVVAAIHPNVIRPSDVKRYLDDRNALVEKRKVQALASSPAGNEIVSQAAEAVGALVRDVSMFGPLRESIQADFTLAQERWRSQMEASPRESVDYPVRHLQAMKSIVDMASGVLKMARQDPQLKAIVQANKVEVNHGMPQSEVFDLINRVGQHLSCGQCGQRGFGQDDMMRALAAAQAARSRSSVIDAASVDAY